MTEVNATVMETWGRAALKSAERPVNWFKTKSHRMRNLVACDAVDPQAQTVRRVIGPFSKPVHLPRSIRDSAIRPSLTPIPAAFCASPTIASPASCDGLRSFRLSFASTG